MLLQLLTACAPNVEPVPGDPAEVAPLDTQNCKVGKEQVPVLHGAQIEE